MIYLIGFIWISVAVLLIYLSGRFDMDLNMYGEDNWMLLLWPITLPMFLGIGILAFPIILIKEGLEAIREYGKRSRK